MRWENMKSEFAICYISSGLSILLVFSKSCIFKYILNFSSLHLFQRNFTSQKHYFVLSRSKTAKTFLFQKFHSTEWILHNLENGKIVFWRLRPFYERKMHFSVTVSAYVEVREPFVKMKTKSYSNTHSYTHMDTQKVISTHMQE